MPRFCNLTHSHSSKGKAGDVMLYGIRMDDGVGAGDFTLFLLRSGMYYLCGRQLENVCNATKIERSNAIQ